jgi:hypothetical protein
VVELGFRRSWCIAGSRELAPDSEQVVTGRVWREKLLESKLASLLVGMLMSSWAATCASEFLVILDANRTELCDHTYRGLTNTVG